MFVEGTLRWQVTEDCPWDLLMALCLRDLAGMTDAGEPPLPAVAPAVLPSSSGALARSTLASSVQTDTAELRAQWGAWWRRTAVRESRPVASALRPPHFAEFDRALALQDLVENNYEAAYAWSAARFDEYTDSRTHRHASLTADVVDVVRDREHTLRRQAGYFRLDLLVLPLASSGAWVVAPHTVAISQSLRDDSAAFRRWLRPIVHALV